MPEKRRLSLLFLGFAVKRCVTRGGAQTARRLLDIVIVRPETGGSWECSGQLMSFMPLVTVCGCKRRRSGHVFPWRGRECHIPSKYKHKVKM
jgi:hypothetical protein